MGLDGEREEDSGIISKARNLVQVTISSEQLNYEVYSKKSLKGLCENLNIFKSVC